MSDRVTGRVRVPLLDADGPELEPLAERLPRRDGRPLNLFRVLGHHPELLKRWNSFGAQLLRGELDVRRRELVILRAAARAQGRYPFAQHVEPARRAGFSDHEIEQLWEAVAPELDDPVDRRLVALVDQLHDDDDVAAEVLDALGEHLTTAQVVEVLVLAGYYRMVANLTHVVRLPLDEGVVHPVESRGG